MAFALWIDEAEGLAWAQGTHEYRPMGAAVISVTDQFRIRDFRKTARHPRYLERSFAGFFASLEEVNDHLRLRKKARVRLIPRRAAFSKTTVSRNTASARRVAPHWVR